MKRLSTVLLILLVCIAGLFAKGVAEAPAAPAAASAVATPKQADKTLVIAVPADFEEKWNPILAENAHDQQVIKQLYVSPQRLNARNEMIDWGGSIKADYTSDGGVLYTVTCKKGMVFSDGEPVTIDDFIYAIYLVSDPSYTGPITIIAEDIDGIAEYYYDNPNIKTVQKLVKEKYSLDTISEADYVAYMKTELWGDWSADPRPEAATWGLAWTDYLVGYCGVPQADVDAAVAAGADAFYELLCKSEVNAFWDGYDPSAYWTEQLNKSMNTGEGVPTIRGLNKIDDYTCTVKYNSINIYGDRSINQYYIPEHYYGKIEKGKVGEKQQTNMVPLGSGPYKWVGFADKIVTCVANPLYFEGCPIIGTVKWQYVPGSDTISSLASGAVDIANPTGTKENVIELDAAGIAYDLTDNAGYGYCGFNSENMSLNVRKGLWCLMSNRQAAIKGYYGKIADVIERPMPTVLAEYPQDAKQCYPYSKEEALKYFNAAGYTQKNGKLVDKSGKQLVVNAYIGGDGIGDHPTFAVLVQAAEDLKSLGGELQIQDVPFNVLQAAMNDGTADIFCLAWGNVNTCDKTTQFKTGGGQNRSRISDAKMDELLDKIVITIDLAERKALVAEMLDRAMDLCLELPVYQRKNILAYNKENINMATKPADTTAFWSYEDVLWKLEMN
ncbi:MAG: ABC transporter substrate-binding protein [Sphaerochaetaceae bacterium]